MLNKSDMRMPAGRSLSESVERPLVVAVAGQPNTGKSTIFNKLTGLRQRVGNWPGKTVDRKEGVARYGACEYLFVDLPGTYGLTANSTEEEIAAGYLTTGAPDAVLAVVNAACLERSMYLVAEVMRLDIPVMLVLNMLDVAEQEGRTVDAAVLSRTTGLPVVGMVGTDRGQSMAPVFDALASLNRCQASVRNNPPLNSTVLALDSCGELSSLPSPKRWTAEKLLEGDGSVRASVEASGVSLPRELEGSSQTAGEVICSRQRWIDEVCGPTTVRLPDGESPTDRWDRLLMHPLWGRIIAFLAIPTGCVLGAALGMFTGGMVLMWALGTGPQIKAAVPGILGSLLANALVPAFGWVCALVSMIGFIYTIFHFLEDTGYLARVACLMDSILGRIGVDGKSAIPLLMGMLCNTVAVAGSRIIDTRRRRVITVAMLPFLPCSGQTGVAFLFAFALFPPAQAVMVVIGVTAVNILMAGLAGITVDRLMPSRRTKGLVMELPLYHKPNFRTILSGVRIRVESFLRGAAGFIVTALILVWAFSYFPNGNVEESYLYMLGHFLEPLGRMVGLDWRFVVALISSFVAKETTAGTLAVLFSVSGADHQAIAEAVRGAISPAGALAFIVASNLYLPCIATISSLRTELGSWKVVAGLLATMLAIALSLAWGAYHIGNVIFT